MDINNKTAIVTGATKGLGAAIATQLVQKGCKVYGLGRNMEALERMQRELGHHFIPGQMDITAFEKVNAYINKTFSNKNSPDILINNAGVGSFQKIDELTSEGWLNMINTNLNALYHITAPVVGLMKKKADVTHIINIGSILGKTGRAEGAAYCTSKFGLSGFSEALAKELRYDNIKVTCVNPGSIETNFFESSGIEKHGNMLDPHALAKTVIHILETPDNMLIDEITIRPLNPQKVQNGIYN